MSEASETIKGILSKKCEIEWISVDYGFPIIPKGKHAVHVLVNIFDHVYEEINPGWGSHIADGTFMKPKDAEEFDFYQLCSGGKYGFTWMLFDDEVTHWAYLPEPIQLEIN